MKKVLILNTSINKGGASRIAHELFENLQSDFDMHFAYGRKTKTQQVNTFYFGNPLEMFIHIFLVRFLGLEGFGSYFSTKKLIRYIQKEKFDLINIHNLHGYYLNFFTLLDFLKKSNIQIIYSLHDEWPITWLPAHSTGCTHCKTGVGICTNTYEYPKNYFPLFTNYMLERKKRTFSNELNMRIVCPSLWLKNNIEHSFLHIFEIETIFNGIDTSVFKPTVDKDALRIKHNIPLDKKVVLFSASNLQDTSKGVHHIIEAARLLQDKNYFFLGLGKGTIDGSENIKTAGYIYDKEQLAELYSLSDVFCFASTAETFLLSAAEALACGVPVVGFDLPVVQELINEDVGILTKTNSDSLAIAIDTLLTNESLQADMGKAGRILIEDTYSKEIFYPQYNALYNELLN